MKMPRLKRLHKLLPPFLLVAGAMAIPFLLIGRLIVVKATTHPQQLIESPVVQPNGVLTNTAYLPLITLPDFDYLPLVFLPSSIDEPHPQDHSVRQSLNSYLAWKVREQGFENAVHTVYLEADNPTPAIVIAETSVTQIPDLATFAQDTQYYWRVVAAAPDGRRIESPVWTFRTDYIPDPPDLGVMVTVPAGEFLMGCDPNNGGYLCFSNQVPLHRVYLDAFEIDKFEITNKEYRACVSAGVCNLPRRYDSASRRHYFFNTEFDYHPVIYVSNADASTYCEWVGKRLPTEAEWEKAAKGGLDTRPWPWGNEPLDCTRANHPGTPNESGCVDPIDTNRVDAYPLGQSPYGLFNAAGNVWEWVQDYYIDGYYSISPYDNPVNDSISQIIPFYSVRGGCFRNTWYYLRTNHRSGGHWGDKDGEDSPLFRSNMYGFRCARTITEP